jgi:hypothetical protein
MANVVVLPFMAHRPDPRSSEGGKWNSRRDREPGTANSYEILRREELDQMRSGLSRLSIDAVRQAYHTAHARCRMVNDHVPSARSIQELVQIWKQLWKWR